MDTAAPGGNRCSGDIRVLSFSLCILALAATAEPSAQPTPPAVEVQNESLGNVLDQIRDATGYEVRLGDDQWRAFPVTRPAEETPTKETLLRLLEAFNYVIIEQSDDGMTLNIMSATSFPTPTGPVTNDGDQGQSPALTEVPPAPDQIAPEDMVPPPELFELMKQEPAPRTAADYDEDLLLLQEIGRQIDEAEPPE